MTNGSDKRLRRSRAGAAMTIAVIACAVLAAFAPVVANAIPITIEFTGTITTIDDAGGLLGSTPPSGELLGHYTVDPDLGTIRIGDGIRGQVPTGTSDVTAGGYHSGGGSAGNTLIDCAQSDAFRPCRNASGIYRVELPLFPASDYLERFTLTLVDQDGSILQPLPLIPPALDEFEIRRFVWTFRNAALAATVTGRITGLRAMAVPEPPVAVLLLAALLVASPVALRRPGAAARRFSARRIRSWPYG